MLVERLYGRCPWLCVVSRILTPRARTYDGQARIFT